MILSDFSSLCLGPKKYDEAMASNSFVVTRGFSVARSSVRTSGLEKYSVIIDLSEKWQRVTGKPE